MAGDVKGLINDPDFQKLDAATQREALSRVSGDQDFAKLSDDDTRQFIGRLSDSTLKQTMPAGSFQTKPGGPILTTHPSRPEQFVDLEGKPRRISPQMNPKVTREKLGAAAPAVGGTVGSIAGPIGAGVGAGLGKLFEPAIAGDQNAVSLDTGKNALEEGAGWAAGSKIMDVLGAGLEAGAGWAKDALTARKAVEAAQAARAEETTAAHVAQDTAKDANISRYRQLEQASGERDAQVARRTELEARQQQLKKDIHQNVQQVHNNVRADLDQRWDAVRTKIGDGTTDPGRVQRAYENALANAPEAAKAEVQRVVESSLGDTLKNPTFKNLQAAYTRLGDSLSGGLQGDTWRAVKGVRMALADTMRDLADSKGALDDFMGVKGDWTTYEKTFKNTGGLAKGGSPLAHANAAEDPEYAIGYVTGKASQRARQMMADHAYFGAKPELLDEFASNAQEMKGLPKTSQPVTSAPYKPLPAAGPMPSTLSPQEIQAIRSMQQRKMAADMIKALIYAGAGGAGAAGYRVYKSSQVKP